MASWSEVVEFSDMLVRRTAEDEEGRRNTNDRKGTFTPMREGRVIRLSEAGQRESMPMRWGWPDLWSPAPINRPKHMHARAETINLLRTFAPSFAERRGILPVKTFNVGEEVGKKVNHHVLTPRDGKPLGIAVIWDHMFGLGGAPMMAFVMVTTPPNALIAR